MCRHNSNMDITHNTDASSRQNVEESINECDNEYTHSVCSLSDLPMSLDEVASEQQSVMPTQQQSTEVITEQTFCTSTIPHTPTLKTKLAKALQKGLQPDLHTDSETWQEIKEIDRLRHTIKQHNSTTNTPPTTLSRYTSLFAKLKLKFTAKR